MQCTCSTTFSSGSPLMNVLVSDSPFVECDCVDGDGDSDGDTEEMVLPQYHHCMCWVANAVVTKAALYCYINSIVCVEVMQRRDSPFIIAEHKLSTHCSVVYIQSVLVSKLTDILTCFISKLSTLTIFCVERLSSFDTTNKIC